MADSGLLASLGYSVSLYAVEELVFSNFIQQPKSL